MPGNRKETMDVREILRRLQEGQSGQAIAEAMQVNRKTVGRNPGKRQIVRGVSHALIRRSEWAETERPTNSHAFRHGLARAYAIPYGGRRPATPSRIMGHSDVGGTANVYSIFTADEL
jgi:integrase